MPAAASNTWLRIFRPCGSLFAATVVVMFLMARASDQILMGGLCLLLLFGWCFCIFVFWALLSPERRIEFIRWDLRQMFAIVGCVAMIVGALVQHWPLKLRFAVSLSELDRLADQLEEGWQMPEPATAGLFVIRKAELRRGTPCLWTEPDSAGPVGFVRCTPEQAESFPNLWNNEQMNERWQLIIED